jgi:hypothetical protein
MMSLQTEKPVYIADKFTPGWSVILERLVVLDTEKDVISNELAPEKSGLTGSPALLEQEMCVPRITWEKLLNRLLVFQKQMRYKPGWTIHQVMDCGNPPLWLLVKLGKNAGYSEYWASKKFKELPNVWLFPDVEEIDWDYWEPRKKDTSPSLFDLILGEKSFRDL